MQRSSAIAFLFACSAGLPACNTTEGLGQDVENAGEAIEEVAEEAEEELDD